MKNQFSLEEAQNYAKDIGIARRLENINYTDVAISLKVLTEAEDEESFRKVIDSFVDYIKNDSELDINLKNQPLSFLEYLCVGIDHGFAELGYGTWEIQVEVRNQPFKIKRTQKYFQKFYGKHFNPLLFAK